MAGTATALADRVSKADPDSGFDLFIYSMYEKPGWQARNPGDRLRVPHPGTAIDYQGAVYEILEIGPGAGTPYTWRYALRKWDDHFVVRQMFPYTAETARALTAAVLEHKRQYRRHSWIVSLFPLTGMFPTGVLRRWQREWGLPMRGASLASIIVVGVLTLGTGSWLLANDQVLPATILLCLGAEQMVRYFWWLSSNEAVGGILTSALWGVWCDLRGLQPDGTPKRRRAEQYVTERDEVRRMREGPWELEVWSASRVPSLVGNAPVRFEDEVYEPLGYIQQGEGIQRRYVFRLRKITDGRTAAREYNPERSASQAALLARYERRRDRAHTWAILCGCLPAARQVELERQYDLNATSATTRSASALLFAGGLQLASALIWPFGIAHFVAGYVVAESLYRLALATTRGEPTGCLLGLLVGPFLKV